MAAEEGAMSPTRMLAEGHLRVATGGGAPADGGITVRHLPHHHPTKKGDRFSSIRVHLSLTDCVMRCYCGQIRPCLDCGISKRKSTGIKIPPFYVLFVCLEHRIEQSFPMESFLHPCILKERKHPV